MGGPGRAERVTATMRRQEAKAEREKTIKELADAHRAASGAAVHAERTAQVRSRQVIAAAQERRRPGGAGGPAPLCAATADRAPAKRTDPGRRSGRQRARPDTGRGGAGGVAGVGADAGRKDQGHAGDHLALTGPGRRGPGRRRRGRRGCARRGRLRSGARDITGRRRYPLRQVRAGGRGQHAGGRGHRPILQGLRGGVVNVPGSRARPGKARARACRQARPPGGSRGEPSG
jgi:hypothetical protein